MISVCCQAGDCSDLFRKYETVTENLATLISFIYDKCLELLSLEEKLMRDAGAMLNHTAFLLTVKLQTDC
jgi:hypothetical protein